MATNNFRSDTPTPIDVGGLIEWDDTPSFAHTLPDRLQYLGHRRTPRPATPAQRSAWLLDDAPIGTPQAAAHVPAWPQLPDPTEFGADFELTSPMPLADAPSERSFPALPSGVDVAEVLDEEVYRFFFGS